MLLISLDVQLETLQNQRLRTEAAEQRQEESQRGRKAESLYGFKAFWL